MASKRLLSVEFPEIYSQISRVVAADQPKETLTVNSKAEVEWRCDKCSASWKQIVAERTKRPERCEGCFTQSLKKRRLSITEDKISNESFSLLLEKPGKKARWTCCRCRNPWRASISENLESEGLCVKCVKRYEPKTDSLRELYPTIAESWIYPIEDTKLTPDNVTSRSKDLVLWGCRTTRMDRVKGGQFRRFVCGNRWVATISSRCNNPCKVCGF